MSNYFDHLFAFNSLFTPTLRKADMIDTGRHSDVLCFIMVALWNRADHYIFILSFVLCSFFFLFLPRLIAAPADWMSAILPHMVWP